MPGKHKWPKGYQEGGPVTNTGIPRGGHAAAPLADYLAGTTQGTPTIDYEAGAIQRELANKMAAAREANKLVEAGVATPEEVSNLFQAQVGQGDWDRPVGEGGHPEGGYWLTGDKAGQKVGAFTPTAIDPGSYEYTSAGLPGGVGKGLDALAGWSVDRQNKIAAGGSARQYRSPQGHLVTVHRGPGGGLVVSGQTGGVDPSVYTNAAKRDGLQATGIAAKAGDAVGKAASAIASTINPPVNTYNQDDDGGGIAGYEGGQSYTWDDVAQETVDSYSDSGADDYDWGFNIGGQVMADDDIWGADPLATSQVQTPQLAQRSNAPSAPAIRSQGPGTVQQLAQIGIPMVADKIIPGSGQFAPAFFNDGDSVQHHGPAHPDYHVDKQVHSPHMLNAGGWVGKRTMMLNHGGMALPEAEMQAYNEMQSMTGPDPVGPDYDMSGMPTPEMVDKVDMSGAAKMFGYIPSSSRTVKDQMEVDKMEIARANAMDKADRDEAAFAKQEARKDEMHKLQMQQKAEAHAESMKQKKAPLADKGE